MPVWIDRVRVRFAGPGQRAGKLAGLSELLDTGDRIAVMCRGQLHPVRAVEDTNEHQIKIEATDLKEAIA